MHADATVLEGIGAIVSSAKSIRSGEWHACGAEPRS
jgi:hypothetical protein